MPPASAPSLRSPRGKTKKKGVRNSAGRQDELREMGESRANGASRDYMKEQTGRASGTRSTGTETSANTRNADPVAEYDYTRPNQALGRDVDFGYYPDLFQNPDLLAQKWGEMNGLTPTTGGGMQKVQQDLAAIMPQLFYLTQGNGTDASSYEYAKFMDFANEFMNSANGVGGASGAPSSDMIANIFNSSPDSMLQQFLNNPNLDTGQQMNNLIGLIGGALSSSMPGASASALMAQADQLGKSWFNQQSEAGAAGNQSFTDFLRQAGFDKYFR